MENGGEANAEHLSVVDEYVVINLAHLVDNFVLI